MSSHKDKPNGTALPHKAQPPARKGLTAYAPCAYIPGMKTYPLPAVLAMIERKVMAAGSLRAYARATGVTAAYVSDVLRSRRDPGPKILAPLGLERIEPRYELRYRKVTND